MSFAAQLSLILACGLGGSALGEAASQIAIATGAHPSSRAATLSYVGGFTAGALAALSAGLYLALGI